MADPALRIVSASVLDNIEERQVEFTGDVDGESYDFAAQYDVLEALSGRFPNGDAVTIFQHYADQVVPAALSALARNSDQERIIISGNDLV